MTIIPSLKLVGHLLMEQPTLPPIPWPRGYLLAGNGLFAWAKREGLEALIPVASCKVAGLYPVEPFVRLDSPPVDVWLVSEVLRLSQEARTEDRRYIEKLFYLRWDQGWQLTVPPQQQEALRVLPMLDDPNDQRRYANTLIEIHSHHTMHAFFSHTDNRDEQGFRIYGVMGCVDGKPDAPMEIRVRVGLYGHFWEIPAATVLSLPRGITDCVVRDQLGDMGVCCEDKRKEDAWYGA